MGVGIVEQVDDFRVSNPPSNPELLEALGKHFTDTKYNLKALVRDICNSRTYQRTTQRNESNAGDERNFAHALVRRIKAENLLDTISAVTDTKDKFDGLPVGARAVQIADGTRSTYFLKTFGRATRETPCSCEVKMEPTLSQALHLLERRHGQRQDQARRADRQAHGHQKVPRGTDHRALYPHVVAETDQGRAGEARPALDARARTSPRRSKISSGRCSTAVNSCSIIDRRRTGGPIELTPVDSARPIPHPPVRVDSIRDS